MLLKGNSIFKYTVKTVSKDHGVILTEQFYGHPALEETIYSSYDSSKQYKAHIIDVLTNAHHINLPDFEPKFEERRIIKLPNVAISSEQV